MKSLISWLFRSVQTEDVFEMDNYDDETRYVLTAPPNWVIRNGITVIFFVLFMLLCVSYFVKYPDTIKTEITISSYNTPADIKARSIGRVNLFVRENVVVKKGDRLGYITNASNFDDVDILKSCLTKIRPLMDSSVVGDITLPRYLNLGEMESIYFSFLTSLEEYILYLKLDSYSKNSAVLRRQILIHSALNRQLSNQKEITVEELKLAKSKLDVDSLLLSEKVIANLDFERSVAAFLPYKKQIEQIELSILNSKLQKAELESRLSELTINSQETRNRLRASMVSFYNNLVSQLTMWEERYLLVAPIDGSVSLFNFWNNNQNVDIGQVILTVVPENNDIFGLLHMPMLGAGKVKAGQTVNIMLHNYPYNEFGLLKGSVVKISDVTQNDKYAVTVSVPEGLITTHGKKLEFREQMKGNAEIVTEDYRLIERFFHQIHKILKDA